MIRIRPAASIFRSYRCTPTERISLRPKSAIVPVICASLLLGCGSASGYGIDASKSPGTGAGMPDGSSSTLDDATVEANSGGGGAGQDSGGGTGSDPVDSAAAA